VWVEGPDIDMWAKKPHTRTHNTHCQGTTFPQTAVKSNSKKAGRVFTLLWWHLAFFNLLLKLRIEK